MKTITKITLSLLVGAAVAVSCKKEEPTYTITADRTEVTDIAATTPGEEVIVVTTDAPYWILQTPEWVTANPVTGVGGGESTIVTLTVAPNYKNETTKTKPRSGALKFSGGKTSLSIPISQLGYQATIDPSLSIGGIPSMEEFRKFITAVNEGASLSEKEVTDYVLSSLARHKVPRYVWFMDRFIMNDAGKIQKFKMREKAVEVFGLEG